MDARILDRPENFHYVAGVVCRCSTKSPFLEDRSLGSRWRFGFPDGGFIFIIPRHPCSKDIILQNPCTLVGLGEEPQLQTSCPGARSSFCLHFRLRTLDLIRKRSLNLQPEPKKGALARKTSRGVLLRGFSQGHFCLKAAGILRGAGLHTYFES